MHRDALEELAVVLRQVDEGQAELAGPAPDHLTLYEQGDLALRQADRQVDLCAGRNHFGDPDREPAGADRARGQRSELVGGEDVHVQLGGAAQVLPPLGDRTFGLHASEELRHQLAPAGALRVREEGPGRQIREVEDLVVARIAGLEHRPEAYHRCRTRLLFCAACWSCCGCGRSRSSRSWKCTSPPASTCSRARRGRGRASWWTRSTWCWAGARRPTRCAPGPRKRRYRRCSGRAIRRCATRGSRASACRRLARSSSCGGRSSVKGAAGPGSPARWRRRPSSSPRRAGCSTSPASTSTWASSTRRCTSTCLTRTPSSAS